MKVIHCYFSSVKHGFRDNEVFCKPDITSSSFGRQEALHAIFHDGFWKSDHNLLIVFHSNFVSKMHGFWDNKVLLQDRYDVIIISSPRGTSDDYSGRISGIGALAPWRFLVDLRYRFGRRVQLLQVYRPGSTRSVLIVSMIWLHRDFFARGRFRRIFMTILEERPWLSDSVPYQLFL